MSTLSSELASLPPSDQNNQLLLLYDDQIKVSQSSIFTAIKGQNYNPEISSHHFYSDDTFIPRDGWDHVWLKADYSNNGAVTEECQWPSTFRPNCSFAIMWHIQWRNQRGKWEFQCDSHYWHHLSTTKKKKLGLSGTFGCESGYDPLFTHWLPQCNSGEILKSSIMYPLIFKVNS